jgi:integrase
MLAYATGARVGSLAGVTVADVHLAGPQPWIHFAVAKWDRPYSVPLGRAGRTAAAHLSADALEAGRELLIGVKPKTIYDWAQQAGATAGIKCWAHLLRHTFATRLAENPTVSPRTWMELMNHRDLSQYRRYARSRQHLLVAAMESF